MKIFFLSLVCLITISCGEKNSSGSTSNGTESGKQYQRLASSPENPVLMYDNLNPELFRLELLNNKTFTLYEVNSGVLYQSISGKWKVERTSIVLKGLGRASFVDVTINGVKSRCIRFEDQSLNSKVVRLINTYRARRTRYINLMFCR